MHRIMTARFRFGIATICAVTAALSAHISGQGVSSPLTDCDVASLQKKAPAGTTITGAAVVPAQGKTPKYCRVDGHVATPGNEVNFRLGLPEGWNRKYYFVGVGGLGGSIGSLDAGLARGYASASTDTGHVGNDEAWGQDRAKEIDYGWDVITTMCVVFFAIVDSLVHATLYDATIAAWRAKYSYNRRRPTEIDRAVFRAMEIGGAGGPQGQRFSSSFQGSALRKGALGSPTA